MPVPVPKKVVPPSPSSTPNTTPITIAQLKKLQAEMQPPRPRSRSPTPLAPITNGYLANGYGNGLSPNGKSKPYRRKGASKRQSSVSSMCSTASASSSVAGVEKLVTLKENVVVTAGAEGRRPPRKEEDDRDSREWRGVMKRVVEEWEIPRKALHSSIGIAVVYLYSSSPETVQPIVTTLAVSLVGTVGMDVCRLRYKGFAKQWEKLFGILMRESERHRWNGVIWYMAGVIYVLTLLPRDLAVMSILILSWCDTAASTIGRLLGRYTPALPTHIPLLRIPLAKKKSLAGTSAAIVTGAITAIAFWGWAVPAWQGYSSERAEDWGQVAWKWAGAPGVASITGGWISLCVVGIVTGVVSGVTEALDLGRVDDNLSLPIISGTILWGLSKLAEWVYTLGS